MVRGDALLGVNLLFMVSCESQVIGTLPASGISCVWNWYIVTSVLHIKHIISWLYTFRYDIATQPRIIYRLCADALRWLCYSCISVPYRISCSAVLFIPFRQFFFDWFFQWDSSVSTVVEKRPNNWVVLAVVFSANFSMQTQLEIISINSMIPDKIKGK